MTTQPPPKTINPLADDAVAWVLPSGSGFVLQLLECASTGYIYDLRYDPKTFTLRESSIEIPPAPARRGAPELVSLGFTAQAAAYDGGYHKVTLDLATTDGLESKDVTVALPPAIRATDAASEPIRVTNWNPVFAIGVSLDPSKATAATPQLTLPGDDGTPEHSDDLQLVGKHYDPPVPTKRSAEGEGADTRGTQYFVYEVANYPDTPTIYTLTVQVAPVSGDGAGHKATFEVYVANSGTGPNSPIFKPLAQKSS